MSERKGPPRNLHTQNPDPPTVPTPRMTADDTFKMIEPAYVFDEDRTRIPTYQEGVQIGRWRFDLTGSER